MKLMMGRIGTQESASVTAIASITGALFTLDSVRAYSDGNSSYIWLPLSIGISFLVLMLLLFSMKKSGANGFESLMTFAFGRVFSSTISLILAVALAFNAFFLLSRFVSMIHSFVFIDSDYSSIALWIMLAVFLVAIGGLERIGRTARIFGVFLLVMLLFFMLNPIAGYEAYRLFPISIDVQYIGVRSYQSALKSLPVFAAMTCMSDGMQGLRSIRRAGTAAAVTGVVTCALVQLALSLSYTAHHLSEMYEPLYRLNMTLLSEGYFFRQDKIALFMWLLGAIIAASYLIYASALISTRTCGANDVRPAIAALTSLAFIVKYFEHNGYYLQVQGFIAAAKDWGFIILAAPVIVACAASLIKARIKRGGEADEKC